MLSFWWRYWSPSPSFLLLLWYTEVSFLLIGTYLLHACKLLQYSASPFVEFMALSLMVKIFSRCSYLDQEFLPLLVFHEPVLWHPTFILVIFLVNFSEDQKYEFTLWEVGVNKLTVFPLNSDRCWQLLKIFHLSCISKKWICAFEEF